MSELDGLAGRPLHGGEIKKLATHQSQPKRGSLVRKGTGDGAGPVGPDVELITGLQGLVAVPATQLLLHPSLASEFRHRLLTQITTFVEADPP